MTSIGLTFDEYIELWLKPPAEASLDFHAAAELERERMFPMPKAIASKQLRSRGYDCHPIMLDAMVEQGVVKTSDADAWSREDLEAAAEHLESCQIFTPLANMCEALGCRYANVLRSLRGGSA